MISLCLLGRQLLLLVLLSCLQVWKARKAGSLQTVAVKLITKHGKNDNDVRNLRQEIDILRKLRHPNIIEMLDAFETKTDFCVVTEFAQGAAEAFISFICPPPLPCMPEPPLPPPPPPLSLQASCSKS